ncbi:NACHT domain-containing protein [Thomasclavelia cocleata]|uniref:NACHT domain-containing protein n=1 Tax=Thomasclavelia cocleata TaxID=69824 RepID=UPI00272ED95F|nr:NACHT domain-containing protein [Thomasclavelia cocleata]
MIEIFSELLIQIIHKIIDFFYNQILKISSKRKNWYKKIFQLYCEKTYKKYSKIKRIITYNDIDNFFDYYVDNVVSTKTCQYTSSQILKSFKYSVIVGESGSGKTMILRKLFLDLINEKSIIPIFISLIYYNNNFNLDIFDYIYNQIKNSGYKGNKKQLVIMMKQGKICLLLDALDELDLKKRKEFISRIDSFNTKYDNVTTIISSCVFYSFIPDYYIKLKTEKFTFEKSIELIKKINNEEKYEKFLKELFYHKEDLKKIIENPLQLTILFDVYAQYSCLPTNLYLYYEKIFEIIYQTIIKKNLLNDFEFIFSLNEFKEVIGKLYLNNLKKGKKYIYIKELDSELVALYGSRLKGEKIIEVFQKYTHILNINHHICYPEHRYYFEFCSSYYLMYQTDKNLIEIIFPLILNNTDILLETNIFYLLLETDPSRYIYLIMPKILKYWFPRYSKHKNIEDLKLYIIKELDLCFKFDEYYTEFVYINCKKLYDVDIDNLFKFIYIPYFYLKNGSLAYTSYSQLFFYFFYEGYSSSNIEINKTYRYSDIKNNLKNIDNSIFSNYVHYLAKLLLDYNKLYIE